MKKITITAAILAALLTQTITTPADAASKGWRYWGYYQAAAKTTQWKAAMTGATVPIANGSVEGWIFTFSGDDVPSTPPTVKPDFATICGKEKAPSGFKKIGLVVDFGNQAYAPKGEKVKKTLVRCVTVTDDSVGLDVLAQEVKIRFDKSGLVCGFNGYPAKECGVEIPTPAGLAKK